MSVASIEPPRRTVVVSRARATAIAEDVAGKHDLPVNMMLCARWDRYAIAGRAELAWSLDQQLGWSLRRIGDFLGCSHTNVRKLFSIHKMNLKRAKRWLPKTDFASLVNIEAVESRRRALDLQEHNAYLQAELDRLTGKTLAMVFGEALNLRLRCAIVLAIVAEAYPRIVLANELLEHYDEACTQLDYGARQGSNLPLMAKNVEHLRDHFDENGWPVPILPGVIGPSEIAGARRLSDEAALFLHERFNAPKLSQIEEAQEQRSRPVLAVVRS